MTRFNGPLENLKIASPCSQDWDSMIGNDRQRFCGACEMYVYNLSGMTREDAESMIATSEGRLCVRMFRRADGSVITKDCPVGLAKIRERMRARVTALVSMLITFFAAIGVMSLVRRPARTVETGSIAIDARRTNIPVPTPEPQALMGDVAITPEPRLGRIEIKRTR